MPNFKDLNLSVNSKNTEIVVNGQKIQVKSYLPVEIKASIVNLAVRGSLLESTINDVLMDTYFHIFIIENYTDIVFEDLEVEDILVNYDKIISNGLLDTILNAIPEEEYNYLIDCLNNYKQQVIEFSRSYPASTKSLQESFDLLNQIGPSKSPLEDKEVSKVILTQTPKSRSRTRRTRN